jgi:hypothetical protein
MTMNQVSRYSDDDPKQPQAISLRPRRRLIATAQVNIRKRPAAVKADQGNSQPINRQLPTRHSITRIRKLEIVVIGLLGSNS